MPSTVIEMRGPEPMRLSRCGFSDIYISDQPDGVPVIRNLVYTDESGTQQRLNGVQRVPDPFLRDLRGLFRSLMVAAAECSQDELMLIHDGARYRCSRIIAPDGMSIRKRDAPQTWCLRRISEGVRPFENLGFTPFIKRTLNSFAHGRGLLLVCGSFGSGKTTTASSVLDHWVRATKEVAVTLEDPPEVNLTRMGSEGTIFQIDMTENSMEEAIKKLRRWAPRFVFLGEIRTAEAAQELLQISQSGPMSLATLHASDPVSAITALVRFAAARMSENDARDLIARTLQGVIYQTLEHGNFSFRYLSVGEPSDFGIRTKIRLGDFQRIDEALEHQEKNRPG